MSESTTFPLAGAPLVSVIVAAYHSADFLPDCLRGLEAQSFQNFETIVVNSSCENQTACVLAAFPTIRLVQSPQRLLPHAAMNLGAQLAKGPLLVFTAADTRADPYWLAALVAASRNGHGLVGGSIETDATSFVARGMQIAKYYHWLRGRPAGRADVVASGNMLVAREIWGTAGPFYGSLYSGDVLFSWLARRYGFEVWFEPDAVVNDTDEVYKSQFLVERFRRGKEFGQVRAAFERLSGMRRILCILYTPVAVLIELVKIGRACSQSGRLADFLLTLPLQIAARLAWCAGEACGYAAAPDHSKTP